MLLAMVLGFTLAIVGPALIRQWLEGALEEPRERTLRPAEFPRLAPPRRSATRVASTRALTTRALTTRAMPMPRRAA